MKTDAEEGELRNENLCELPLTLLLPLDTCSPDLRPPGRSYMRAEALRAQADAVIPIACSLVIIWFTFKDVFREGSEFNHDSISLKSSHTDQVLTNLSFPICSQGLFIWTCLYLLIVLIQMVAQWDEFPQNKWSNSLPESTGRPSVGRRGSAENYCWFKHTISKSYTKSAETFHRLCLCLSQVSASTFPSLFAMLHRRILRLSLYSSPWDGCEQ